MNERTHAIVLGGGGISGIAWEAALLAGLIDAGLPVEEADAFGTSAGSVVATLLLSGHLRPEALGSLMQMSMEPEGDHGHEAMAFALHRASPAMASWRSSWRRSSSR